MTEMEGINRSAGTGYDELDRGWGGRTFILVRNWVAAGSGSWMPSLSVTRCHNIVTPTRPPPTLYQRNFEYE